MCVVLNHDLVDPSVNTCDKTFEGHHSWSMGSDKSLEGHCSQSMGSDKAGCFDSPACSFLDNIAGTSSTNFAKSG